MSAVKQLILVGGGGHAAVVADAARASGWHVLGYVDDAPQTQAMARLAGLRFLGAVSDVAREVNKSPGALVHVAVGTNSTRKHLAEATSDLLAPAIIHPSAVVSDSARIEPGSLVGAMAVVQARAAVGRGVIINTGAIVEHDCALGAWSHIAPSAVLTGDVAVGEEALVGTGARVIPGRRIGVRAVVGAGACVIDDVPDGATVVGVPARIVV